MYNKEIYKNVSKIWELKHMVIIFILSENRYIFEKKVQALKHHSADAGIKNGHKFDTTAATTLCQKSKTNDKIKMAAITPFSVPHANRLVDPENLNMLGLKAFN